MTKKIDLVQIIAERANVSQPKTKEIIQWTFDAIIDAIVLEGRIELRNFGVFEVKTRKERQARNPNTNEPLVVPCRNVVTFRPGKEMWLRVSAMPKQIP